MEYQKLLDAARTGNVEQLQRSLEENPLILTEFSLAHESQDTILHIATKAGHLNFVSQILKHKPELARESNSEGYRPLDIAAALGSAEIVKEFLKNNHAICRLKGRDERTALHFAAAGGRIGVIDELLSACFECIKDVTVWGETALHLAVKNNKYEAFRSLVKWVERPGMEEIINWGDCDGNTVLHLAASRKQIQSIKLLLSNSNPFNGEMNARNSKGLTAMDILDILMETPSDVQLREILLRAGALRALPNATAMPKPQQDPQSPTEAPLKDWFQYFKFQRQRDSPSDTRNVLLVVATLIASVTFQAGINPPAGLLEYSQKSNATKPNSGGAPQPPRHPLVTSGLLALSAELGSQATTVFLFLFGNTLGLTASLSIIIYLTGGFPFQRELLISIYAMMFTYGFSIHTIKPNNAITYALLTIAFVLPFSLRWFPWWGKKAWKWWNKPSTTRSQVRDNKRPILL